MTAIDDLMTAITAPQSWERVQIKDIYLALYDGPHATPKPAAEGAVFLGIKNITEDGKLDLSEIRYISEEDFPKWTRRVLPRPGDIVFTYEATLNRYAIIPEGFRGCLGRRLALIRPNPEKVDTRFLFYYFFGKDWHKTIATNLIFGSTVDRIPLTNFPKFEISLPPLPIQRKIAAILSAYDDLIENNTRRIEILEEMARSLYREWFVNFRFPGHEQVQMVDSDLGLIPEGWEVNKLGEVIRFKNGKSIKAEEEGNYLVYGSNGIIGRTNEARYQNAIIIGRVGAYCGSLVYSKSAFNASDNTIIAESASEKISIELAFYILEQMNLRHYAGGAAQPLLTQTVIKEIPVIVPDIQTNKNFQMIMENLLNLKVNLTHKIQNLRLTRDLLLPKLISGEIDVENLDIKTGETAA